MISVILTTLRADFRSADTFVHCKLPIMLASSDEICACNRKKKISYVLYSQRLDHESKILNSKSTDNIPASLTFQPANLLHVRLNRHVHNLLSLVSDWALDAEAVAMINYSMKPTFRPLKRKEQRFEKSMRIV